MQRMVQIKDNQIIKYSLPKTGYLSDGSSVSGYDLRMIENPELAKQEGWLPLEDNPPEFNPDTQYILQDGYEILEDKVIVKYKIEDIIVEPIEPQPSEIDILNERINTQDAVIEEILFDIIPTMLGGMGGE